MAKYTINHRCGHSREIQLCGSNSERTRKIAWMESQECPQCWGAKQRAAEAAKPIIAEISLTMDTAADGTPLAQIVLSGGCEARKDELKSLGYIWGEIRGGAMSLLSMSDPRWAWHKLIPVHLIGDTCPDIEQAISQIKPMTTSITSRIDPITLQLIRERSAKKQAQDQAIAEIPAPVKPACYPTNYPGYVDGSWNGTIYSGNRIYISGVEHRISAEDAKQIKDYQAARKIYREKIESIKK